MPPAADGGPARARVKPCLGCRAAGPSSPALSLCARRCRPAPRRRRRIACRDDLTEADRARVAAVTAPTTDFTQARALRADVGRRGAPRRRRPTATPSRIPRPTSPSRASSDFKLGNGLFRKTLGVVAVLDPGVGRARAAVQRARLPELPSQGRPRASAAGPDDRAGLDVPAPVGAAADRRRRGGAGERRRCSRIPEPTYGGQLQNFAVPGVAGRRRDADHLRGDAGDARRRRDGVAAQADLQRRRSRLRPDRAGRACSRRGSRRR